MTVRAKFRVQSVTDSESGTSVVLFAVHGGSPENEKFFKQTPSGRLEIGILNAAAAEQFKPGGTFYLDFTPVEGV